MLGEMQELLEFWKLKNLSLGQATYFHNPPFSYYSEDHLVNLD